MVPRKSSPTKRYSAGIWVVVMGGGLCLTGCGGGNPFPQVQVAGKVTYEDGAPISGGQVQVIFVPETPPLDPKTYPRNGSADVGPDGTMGIATSYRPGDGVTLGKHKVIVRSLDGEGRPTSAVPREYWSAATTPLEIDTADSPFHLKVKKP